MEIEFEYYMPNDVTLHVTAEMSPGEDPQLYGLPENCSPGSPPEAEIIKTELKETDGTMVEFDPDGFFIRQRLATSAIPMEDDIREKSFEAWETAQ